MRTAIFFVHPLDSDKGRAIDDGPKEGTCCSCAYHGENETPCSVREDGTHCVHWWDGDKPEHEPLGGIGT